MGRGKRREVPPSCKTYGFPVYCASWIPLHKVVTVAEPADGKEAGENEGADDEVAEEAGSAEDGSVASEEVSNDALMLVLGGGGGEGRSGIPNVLLLAKFDPASRSLAEEPVHRHATGQDVPYRMALHPGGEGFLCSFPNGCRWFEWDYTGRKTRKLSLKLSNRTLTQLEDAGLQLALAFNTDGSLLATGGEEGHIRIFKWPAMETILEENETNQSVKDLDFSFEGKFLASVGNSGQCRIWDLTSNLVVMNLARGNGEKFGFCRFSKMTNDNNVLYTTASQGQFACIVAWSCTSWNRILSKQISKDPISAFNVSNDGTFLAIGTIDGDVKVLNSSDMQVHATVKRAHLGLVTALSFSQDSRALVSASFDSTVQVTMMERQERRGTTRLWVVILFVLLAILAYYVKALK